MCCWVQLWLWSRISQQKSIEEEVMGLELNAMKMFSIHSDSTITIPILGTSCSLPPQILFSPTTFVRVKRVDRNIGELAVATNTSMAAFEHGINLFQLRFMRKKFSFGFPFSLINWWMLRGSEFTTWSRHAETRSITNSKLTCTKVQLGWFYLNSNVNVETVSFNGVSSLSSWELINRSQTIKLKQVHLKCSDLNLLFDCCLLYCGIHSREFQEKNYFGNDFQSFFYDSSWIIFKRNCCFPSKSFRSPIIVQYIEATMTNKQVVSFSFDCIFQCLCGMSNEWHCPCDGCVQEMPMLFYRWSSSTLVYRAYPA